MESAGKAVLVILGEQARERGINEHPLLHIAERSDPQLAMLMRKVQDAQRQLDAYVIGKLPTPRSA